MALKVNDEVCFLNFGKLHTGTIVIPEKNKLIKVKCSTDGNEYFIKSRFVVAIDAKFCIVQKEQSYSTRPHTRFDFSTYRIRNKTWESWTNPQSWIQEFIDPYDFRFKATVYGLEI